MVVRPGLKEFRKAFRLVESGRIAPGGAGVVALPRLTFRVIGPSLWGDR
jgi:hypothetical protein